MPFLGKQPTAGFASIVKDDLTPDGSTTAFTLSKQVASANDIAVFVGNVRQEPTDAYSVSGTTLTMTAAPASGVNFYVLHIAGTVESSVVPAAGTSVPGAFDVSGALTSSSLNVSGDLTVDTSTLKVDSANNRVGIGTTSPTDKFHVESAGANYIKTRDSTSGGIAGLIMQNGSDTRGIRINNATTEIYDHSAGAARLLVNSNGYVTKPYQPTFRVASANATQSLNTSATPVVIDFDNVTFDTTSSYNTSTNRYTAPVSGYYYMNAAVMFQSNFTDYNYIWMSFRINGTVHSDGEDMMPRPSGGQFSTLSKNEIILHVIIIPCANIMCIFGHFLKFYQGQTLSQYLLKSVA